MIGFLLGRRHVVNRRLGDAMPSLPVLHAFMAATLALNITQGADMAYVNGRNG
jgi:hypothetical protein